MAEIELDEEKFVEIAPAIAATGPSEELAQRVEMKRWELERFIAQEGPREVIEGLRRELVSLLADKLLLLSPEALKQLEKAVGEGARWAIENILDRSGFPRSSRTDIRALVGKVDLTAPVDFGKYLQQADGDFDEVEAGLERMKKEAVDGAWREEAVVAEKPNTRRGEV